MKDLTFKKLILSPATFFVLVFLVGASLTIVIRANNINTNNSLSQLPVFGSIVHQHEETMSRSILIDLNYYIPSFSIMANFMKNPDLIDVNIDQHEKYYNKLITLFPAMHEVYGTLGYLHYRNGNISTALSFYKKAMDLNPQFFWYPYDMAIIFMNNKRYQEAAALFQYALNVNPVNSVISIMQSKVYQQIFVGTGATMDLKNSIQNGVENAMAGLKFCTNNSNAEKNDPPALHVQIF